MILFLFLSAFMSAQATLTWIPDSDVDEPPGYPNDTYIDDTSFLDGGHDYLWYFYNNPSSNKSHVLGEFQGSSSEMNGLAKQWMTIGNDTGCVACSSGYSGHPGMSVTLGSVHYTGTMGVYGRTLTISVEPGAWPNATIDDPELVVICLPIRPNGTIPEDPYPNCQAPGLGISFGGIP